MIDTYSRATGRAAKAVQAALQLAEDIKRRDFEPSVGGQSPALIAAHNTRSGQIVLRSRPRHRLASAPIQRLVSRGARQGGGCLPVR